MAIFKNIRTTGLAKASPLFNPRPFLYFDTSTYDNRENLLAGSPNFQQWSLNNGATIVHNQSVAPNNRQEATLLTHTQNKQINATGTPLSTAVAGEYYTFSCYYKNTGSSQSYHQLNCGGTGGTIAAVDINWVSETVTTRFGTPVSSGITNIGNGWYRVWIVGLIGIGGTSLTPFIVSASVTDNTVLIWGAQLEKGQYPSNFVNTNNVLFQSEAIEDNFSYSRGGLLPISVNQIASPTNTLTADAIIENTALNTYHFVRQTAIKSSLQEYYTFSCYLKNISSNREIEILIQDGTNGVNTRFNPANGLRTGPPGAYGTGYSAVAAGSEFVGNGWYRVFLTAITTTSTNIQAQIALTIGSSNVYTGDGTSGVYVWGLQLEPNMNMSDYAPNIGTLIRYRSRSTTIVDIGSSANNGVLQSGLYPDASGVFTFNGTSHNITTTTTYPTVNSTNFTLTGMFKTTVASGKKIVGFQSTQSGEVGASYDKNVYVDTSGKLVWGVYDGAVQIITSAITVNDGAWHHFAATHDFTNTRMELFVDGVSQGTINKRTNDGTTWLRIGSFYQGGWPGGLNGYWPGSLSHIGFYPGVFTAEQAQSHMYALRSNENIVKDRVVLNIDANKVATVGQVVSRNLIPIPEAFNTGLWGSFCGDTSNMTYNTTEVAAPDGTFTATKVVRNNVTACGAGAGWGFLWQASNIFSVGQTYTVSVYARLATGSNPASFQLGLNDFHMLGVGSLTTSWQRYTVTRTIGSSSPNELDRGIQFISTDQNCSFYVWGAQMEPGSTMTTYYPQSTGVRLAPLTTAQDISGNNNTATLQRSTYFTVNPNRFEIDASNITSNNGLFLSSTINIADTATYTVSAWVKSKATPAGTYHSIIGSAATTRWVGIEHNDTTGSNWRFFFRQLGGTFFNSTNFTYNISANWANITFTVDAARNVRVYLNGAFSQTLTPTTTELNISRIGAGYSSGGTFYPFNGALSNCLIYSKTLSALEVKQNFDAQRWRFGI
jgi:hypothetical protein